MSPFENARRTARRLGLDLSHSDALEETLALALTHSSYAHESGVGGSNERLEFLGDAVLDLLIAEELYRRYPQATEGQLSKLKASIVSRPTLARVAERIQLGKDLLLSKGEVKTGGRTRPSILADALESVIGAVYLCRGLLPARELAFSLLKEEIDHAGAQETDYKTALQEWTQAHSGVLPEYRVVDEEGSGHSKRFSVQVHYSGELLGEAYGRSKKEAEQLAARQGLEKLEFANEAAQLPE